MDRKVRALRIGQNKPICLPGGDGLAGLVGFELWQAHQDGRDPTEVARLAKRARTTNEGVLLKVYERLINMPVSPKFPYTEPNDLVQIRKLRPRVKTRKFQVPQSPKWLFDRLYGAWLGRCAACTLGGPGEGFRPNTREQLKKYLTAVSPDEWPIKDYMPQHSPGGLTFCMKLDATREQLRYAPADDDLTHTVIAQIALREAKHPALFQTRDLASVWFRYVPYSVTVGGTALLAYRNLVMRYPMWPIMNKAWDDSAFDWNWVATHSNPFREDIDAAIRADSYGYAVPGQPELAAELAWRDARISNVKNGVYCSMFYAAMIAAAFALDEPLKIVEAGLAEIPKTSRLYAAARTTICLCRRYGFRHDRIEQVHDAIYKTFGDDHCGTPNNMAAVVSGLLMGGHDFEKVITYTVMAGWDCDSTAATAGSIAGAMLGAKRLPKKWIRPLRDTLHGQIVGYQPITISECARRSVQIAENMFEIDALTENNLKLPRECLVFGPVERDAPIPEKSSLAIVPEVLTFRGRTLRARKMKLGAEGRIDLGSIIGATGPAAEKNGAYVYMPFRSDKNQRAMFGFGADWWFTAYLDGRPIATNEPAGNGANPPRVDNFISSPVKITRGSHVLTVRFLSGQSTSVLAVGGPAELRKSLNLQSI